MDLKGEIMISKALRRSAPSSLFECCPAPHHTPYEITSLCAFAPEFGPNLWGQLGYVYKITWEYGYKYMRARAYIYTRTLTYKHTLDI